MGHSKNLTEENPSIKMNPNLEWMNYDNRNSTENYSLTFPQNISADQQFGSKKRPSMQIALFNVTH